MPANRQGRTADRREDAGRIDDNGEGWSPRPE